MHVCYRGATHSIEVLRYTIENRAHSSTYLTYRHQIGQQSLPLLSLLCSTIWLKKTTAEIPSGVLVRSDQQPRTYAHSQAHSQSNANPDPYASVEPRQLTHFFTVLEW